MKRTLNINFSDEALDMLSKQNKRLVLVKESNEPAPIDNAVIAWFTTNPFQNVAITWDEEFYLYGSQTEFQSGAVIDKSSSTNNPLVDGSYCYNFGPNAANFKSNEISSGKAGTFYMKNLYQDNVFTVFGLAQKISSGPTTVINPINAVEAIYNDNIEFTPVEKIKVFLQSNVQDAKVLTSISSEPISLDFTGNTTQTITYDSKSNRFIKK